MEADHLRNPRTSSAKSLRTNQFPGKIASRKPIKHLQFMVNKRVQVIKLSFKLRRKAIIERQ
ncbi:MAG: hypothetical protein DRO00_03685 [Thermoproteota archaeon]|nr:MAG: hypothetical protein DRO00_03685 [Candidatus Korarchaeota archaeon]